MSPPPAGPSPSRSPAPRRRPPAGAIRSELGGRERGGSLAKRWTQQARAGLPGLLVSTAIHGLLLAAMALIFVHRQRSAEDAALELAWSPVDSAVSERPLAPVRIEAAAPIPRQRAAPSADRRPAVSEPSASRPSIRPVPVDRLLETRDPVHRREILASQGESRRIEEAIAAGLNWLARQQQSAGNWRLHEGYPDAGDSSLRTDTGATSLALLAFLGGGQTHQRGEHAEVVRRGLDWLTGIQKENGDFHDHEELGRQTAFYAHSLATIAVCESFALSGDAALREPAVQAVAFLLESQHPRDGGWKYMPQDVASVGDLSVTSWALMALHTARTAGVDVPEESFSRAAVFLDSVAEQDGARYRYMPTDPPGRHSAAMTAAGLLCRQFLGWPADHPPLQEGIEWLSRPEHEPQWSAGRRNVYAWYHVGHVLHNAGGDAWTAWWRKVSGDVLARQVRSGSRRPGSDVHGSWHPRVPAGAPHEHVDKAGRLYLTTMCLLILETPYRYRPLHEALP